MADIFLSYASEDRARVSGLVDALRRQGWSVWWDREIVPGSPFEKVIEQAIGEAQCVVVVWSRHSVQSDWVQTEALDGLERALLVPIMIDDVRLPLAFKRAQAVQLMGWPARVDRSEFDRFLAAVAKQLGEGARARVPDVPTDHEGGGRAGSHRPSVAVLPFVNLTSDPENQYLSDGIAAELIFRLTQEPALRVAAQSSSFYFRDRQENVQAVGQLLNVNHVLEGSFRRFGSRARVTVQLVNTGDGHATFAHHFDVDTDDMFELQEQLAIAIAKAIRAPLRIDRSERKIDQEAHRLYLQARFHYFRADPASRRAAAGYFRQALSISPEYGEASAGLAWSLLPLAIGSFDAPPCDVLDEALRAAQLAVELDPSSAFALGALGTAHLMNWDWEAGRSCLAQALSLGPPDASTAYGYSIFLAASGQLREALAVCEDAFTREPLSPMLTEAVSRMLHYLGRLDEAEAVCQSHLRHVPDSEAAIVGLMEIYLQHGNIDKAREYLDHERSLPGIHPAQAAFHELRIAAAARDVAGFSAAFERLLTMRQDAYVPAFVLAIGYLLAQDQQRCLEFLWRAVEERDPFLLMFDAYEWPHRLQEDKSFQRLRARLALPRAAASGAQGVEHAHV